MSMESAKAFWEKYQNDLEFRKRLNGVNSEEKFFAVVKASGYDFTKAEWLHVVPIKCRQFVPHRRPGSVRWADIH